MATAPRRKQHERVAESSEKLLAATVDLIAEQGFEKTTASQIAERAGYSRSMVRVRYGSKEELLETLLRGEFETAMLQEPDPDLPGLEQVLGQLDLVVDLASERPAELRAFWVLSFESVGPIESLRPWMQDWLGRYRASTEASFAAGIEDGSVRADFDPGEGAKAIITGGLGLAFQWTLDPEGFDVIGEMLAWRERLRRDAAPLGA